MSDHTLVELVAPLTKATESGSLVWTVDEGQFSTDIGENKVAIWPNGRGCSMAVRDQTGKTIDYEAFFPTDRVAFNAVSSVFRLMDRRHRNVDGILSDILTRLEAATSANG